MENQKGLWLYLIYIKHISVALLNAEYRIFANDTNLYKEKDGHSLQQLIDADLTRLNKCVLDKTLTISIEKKTKYIMLKQKKNFKYKLTY